MSKQFPYDFEISCTYQSYRACGKPATQIVFKEDTQQVIKARCNACSINERFKDLEDRVKSLEQLR